MTAFNQHTISDTDLLAFLLTRDEKAFSYLYENYSSALFGIIKRILILDEASEDALQETFVKIWKNLDTYDSSKGRLFTWMLSIARNTALDVIKSKSFNNASKNRELTDSVNMQDPSHPYQQLDSLGIRKVINRLKEEYRIIIELSYFQGFTQEEISKNLGIPLGTVKTRARNALIALKGIMV